MIDKVIKKIKNIYANVILFFVDLALKVIISFLKEAIIAKELNQNKTLEKDKLDYDNINKCFDEISQVVSAHIQFIKPHYLTEQMKTQGGIGDIWRTGKRRQLAKEAPNNIKDASIKVDKMMKEFNINIDSKNREQLIEYIALEKENVPNFNDDKEWNNLFDTSDSKPIEITDKDIIWEGPATVLAPIIKEKPKRKSKKPTKKIKKLNKVKRK